MENYRTRKRQGLAETGTEFRRFGHSPSDKERSVKPQTRPRFHIKFQDNRSDFLAEETLSCEYRIDLPNAGLPAKTGLSTNAGVGNDSVEAGQVQSDLRQVASIETSVLWQTEGKGDEDIGVHFFERREKKLAQPEILRQLHRLHTVLPRSPLSYDGTILKLNWLVRVRIFLDDGASFTEDLPFKLGRH
jgi:hypothetical protein